MEATFLGGYFVKKLLCLEAFFVQGYLVQGYFVQGYFVQGYFVQSCFVQGYFVQDPIWLLSYDKNFTPMCSFFLKMLLPSPSWQNYDSGREGYFLQLGSVIGDVEPKSRGLI